MPISPILRWALVCLLVSPLPLAGQDSGRIWARATTTDGEQFEGFLRWDRNEGSWVDILDGTKEIPDAFYEEWLAQSDGGERPTRTIELRGYRISWNELDPDFPRSASSGVRFGHIAELVPTGRLGVEVILRSGQRFEFTGGSTDIGVGMRGLIVEDRRAGR